MAKTKLLKYNDVINLGYTRMFSYSLIIVALLGIMPKVFGLGVNQAVDFDDDAIGTYTKDDFKKDWNMFPTSSSGQKDGRLNIEYELGTTNKIMKVTYLAGKVGGNSAMTFTAPLNGRYRDLFFQYKVKFADNFTWVKGGKLPGLTSGHSPTGCIANGTFTGFSARRMWRETGVAWSYLYNPVKVEECGDYYALDYKYYLNPYPNEGNKHPAISPVYFSVGPTWNTLTQEVHLNDPGLSNGYIKEWFNGEQVLYLQGLNLDGNYPIDQVKMDTFFGGSSSDWAPATNQYAYFDDFSVSETMPAMY